MVTRSKPAAAAASLARRTSHSLRPSVAGIVVAHESVTSSGCSWRTCSAEITGSRRGIFYILNSHAPPSFQHLLAENRRAVAPLTYSSSRIRDMAISLFEDKLECTVMLRDLLLWAFSRRWLPSEHVAFLCAMLHSADEVGSLVYTRKAANSSYASQEQANLRQSWNHGQVSSIHVAYPRRR